MCIYIYLSQISLLSLIFSHSVLPSIWLLSPSTLAFHYSSAWEIVFRMIPVISDDFCITISYVIWVSRSRDSPINIQTSNIVDWHRNRSLKIASSYISLFEHGQRLNSTVSYHANNRKFGRMLRWLWQNPFDMKCEHDGVDATLSIIESQT